ncbi:MAG: hypothetical protein JOZ87_01020 [Chloroflexi bacterium]|nr:hypothetical protein [Chloroflexota bacterium]
MLWDTVKTSILLANSLFRCECGRYNNFIADGVVTHNW